MSKRKKATNQTRRKAIIKTDNTRVAKPIKTQKSANLSNQASSKSVVRPMTFSTETYKWMGIGLGLVFLGLILMMGGRGEDPTVFDESKIYGFRQITLAPIVILSGLGTVIYAILKK